MSTTTGARAQAKIVGEDLEWLVSRAVDGLALVDEFLAGSWCDTGRSEGYVAKLTWQTILEDAD